jgi:PhnB protein
MPKLSLSEQLDRAVQAILAPAAGERQRDGDGLDPKVAPLARIAEQLRGLPREDFRARLKAEFEGSAPMASKPATAATTEQGAAATQQEQKLKAPGSYIHPGFKTLTPYITVQNAPELIDFVKQVFDAEETLRTTGPTGGIHCELRVGNSMVMVGGGGPGSAWSGTPRPTSIHVYVADCDATYQRALKAGATSVMQPTDQPYGERQATVKDASGNNWFIAFPTYLGDPHYDPDRVQTVQAYLHPPRAEAVIDFVKSAFGAEEMGRASSPEGLILHTTIKIGDSTFEMSDARGPYQAMPTTFYLYVEDVDASYRQALSAGGVSIGEPTDEPYGDRVGAVKDSTGNQWYIATHLGDAQAKTRVASAQEAAAPVKYIREGFHTLTPYLLARNAVRLIDFFKAGFGAEERFRVPQPGGKIMHAELLIGDSILELSDGSVEFPARSTMHILHVDDVDATYERAIRAGATSLNVPREQPYGDREAGVMDPDGNHWYITELRQTGHMTPDTRTILPGSSTRGAAQFIEFMKQAFGAEEAFMHKSPSGTVIHSRIRIGDSILAIGELRGELAPMPFHMHMYVPNIDAVYDSALRAGAKTLRAPRDEPYGDRAATVEDAFGNYWSLATHIKDVHF